MRERFATIVAAVFVCIAICQAQTADTSQSPSVDQTAPIQIGRPIHADDPNIPKELRKKYVTAAFSATITAAGDFSNITLLTGDQDFTDLALDAVRQWHYSPPTQDGKPVDAKVYVVIGANRGKVSSLVEPELPVPMQPREPIKDLVANGRLCYVVSGKVKPPKAKYTPDPEYSELARRGKYQGISMLGVIVGADGTAQDVWVVRKLGMGLDQKAIDVVRTWKFDPATKDEQPVAVLINVEVSFRLY